MKKSFLQCAFLFAIAVMVVVLVASLAKAQPSGYPTTSIDVTELSFTPSAIDVTDSSQTITVTARVISSERDFWWMSVTFTSPVIGHMYGIQERDRISGNARDGVYRATFTFPQYSERGSWRLSEIRVGDGSIAYSRWREFNSSFITSRGFPTQLDVTNNNEAVPPELSDFNFTPTTIGANRNVTLTVRAKDLASGISSLGGYFLVPAECYIYDEPCDAIGFNFTAVDRISGDERDGVYRTFVNVPTSVLPGTYSASLVAADGVNNISRFRSYDLAQRGYPYQLTLADVSFVGVSGRVLNPSGTAVRNATVTLTDSQGFVRKVTTGSFGHFSFSEIATGSSYTVAVDSKRYRFAPRTIQLQNNLNNLDFVGLE